MLFLGYIIHQHNNTLCCNADDSQTSLFVGFSDLSIYHIILTSAECKIGEIFFLIATNRF